jgi:hypothetical protein
VVHVGERELRGGTGSDRLRALIQPAAAELS